MDYVVELDFEGPGFVAVPNAVVDDSRVSADALAALVYMARLAGGRGARIVRVSAIRSRFGWGERKWQGAYRNLFAVGALKYNYDRSSDGRSVVRSLAIGWPGKYAVEPVTDKKAVTGEKGPTKRRSPDRQKGGHLTDKKAVLKTEETQTEAVPLPAPQSAKAAASAVGGKVVNPREAGPVDNSTGTGARGEASQDAENVQSEAGRTALDGWDRAAVEALRGSRPAYVAGRWIEVADPAWREAHRSLVFADMAAKRARVSS